MIPKIIHYVWVGDAPKSDLALKCIESWKKYCPDYEIKEWGNDILSEIDNQYVKEAFEAKKWAFVSDYIRLYVLQKYGGVYLDTDLEITQNIDKFLENDFFMGHEIYEGKFSYLTALMASVPHNKIVEDILSVYKNIHFIENGKLDMTPNPKKFKNYFNSHFGIEKIYAEKEIYLSSTEKVYPYYYFCVKEKHKDNYAVHHFNGSWLDRNNYARKDKIKIGRYFFTTIKKTKFLKTDFNENDADFPISKNEKVIVGFSKSKNKKIYLLKEENNEKKS